MASQSKHSFSVQEYLDQEELALDRHEYLNGKIFATAGGTLAHSLIASNLMVAIGPQLKHSDCRVLGSDMRLRTSPTGLHSYADAVIACKPEVSGGTTLLNPVVIVEVLSESTEDYDRGGKFERYRDIQSFREYLVVAQDRMYVEHHVREGSTDKPAWIMRQFNGADDTVCLNAVNVSLPLAVIYSDVSLPATLDPVPQPQ